MRRTSVIGTSCVGKSTFAGRLAAGLGVAHVELDALHWNPDWVETPGEVFRARVREAAARDGWVIDGNYVHVQDVIWARAEAVVWLDYPFRVVFWRALKRTARRAVSGERCCN